MHLAAIESLRTRRIFFGHQSVGGNIIAGIERLNVAAAGAMRIVETADPTVFTEPALAHACLGVNRQPSSKTDAFVAALHAGLGRRTDIALLKFCYVDVTRDSDTDAVLSHYVRAMTGLRAAFPAITFVHVTVPVTVMPGLLRRTVGGLLRQRNRVAEDNLARADYNRKLVETYADREPVFDLAGVESVFPSGRPNRFRSQGREFRALVPAYSSDGRHLSETGQDAAAGALLRFLAQLPSPQTLHDPLRSTDDSCWRPADVSRPAARLQGTDVG